MKCRFCGEEVRPRFSYFCLHTGVRSWDCPNCGVIKSFYVVDGEVVRKWFR